MSLANYQKWVEMGKSLGFDGTDLVKFVTESQATERAEQTAERDEPARERDRDRERREQDDKREREKREHEAREHEHELAIKRLEGEMAERTGGRSLNTTAIVKSPRLPEFKEKTDQMDAYLERFERFATAQAWKKDIWATNLSTLLTGKALDVYSRIPSADDALNYTKLKEALLKAYQLTVDGFRLKFQQTRCENGETPT